MFAIKRCWDIMCDICSRENGGISGYILNPSQGLWNSFLFSTLFWWEEGRQMTSWLYPQLRRESHAATANQQPRVRLRGELLNKGPASASSISTTPHQSALTLRRRDASARPLFTSSLRLAASFNNSERSPHSPAPFYPTDGAGFDVKLKHGRTILAFFSRECGKYAIAASRTQCFDVSSNITSHWPDRSRKHYSHSRLLSRVQIVWAHWRWHEFTCDARYSVKYT